MHPPTIEDVSIRGVTRDKIEVDATRKPFAAAMPPMAGTFGRELSNRQREIAALIVAGKSTRAIAESLGLSPRTVETHVLAIFEKLGVRKRVEVAAIVVRRATVARLTGISA